MKIINLKNTNGKSYMKLELTFDELEKYNLKLGQEIDLLEILEKQQF